MWLKIESSKQFGPKYNRFKQLQIAMKNKQKWREFITQMQEKDSFFNPFLFEENFLDSSVLLRMIRRPLAQKHQRDIINTIHTEQGFNEKWEGIPALRLIA